MAEETASIDIVASVAGAIAPLQQLGGAVGALQGQFAAMSSGITNAVNMIRGPLMGLTALLGGGKLFSAAIRETQHWEEETKKLSRQLGVSLTEASAYRKVLSDLGIGTESIQAASRMLTMRIAAGGKAFTEAGIAVFDSNYKMRSTASILGDITKKYQGLSTEGDKNLLLQRLLGRSYEMFIPIIRVTEERLAAARKELAEFGINVTEESIKVSRDYQEAMNNVGDVVHALSVTLGRELMPVLTDVSKELRGASVSAFAQLRAEIKDIVGWIDNMLFFVEMVVQGFRLLILVLESVVIALVAVGRAIVGFVTGGLKGASDAIAKQANFIRREWSTVLGDSSREIDAWWERWQRRAGTLKTPEKPKETPAKGGEGETDVISNMLKQQAREELLQRKIARGRELTLQEQISFWIDMAGIAQDAGAKAAYEAAFSHIIDLYKKFDERTVADKNEHDKKMTSLGEATAEKELALARREYIRKMAIPTNEARDRQKIKDDLLVAEDKYAKELKKRYEEQLGHELAMGGKRRDAALAEIGWLTSQKLKSVADSLREERSLEMDGWNAQLAVFAERRSKHLANAQAIIAIDREQEKAKADHEAKLAEMDRRGRANEMKIADEAVANHSKMVDRIVSSMRTEARFKEEIGATGPSARIEAELKAENIRYANQVANFERDRALYALNSEERKRIDDAMEEAKAAHNDRMKELDRDSIRAQIENVKLITEPIKNSFRGMFDSIIDGSVNMKKVIEGLWKSLAKSVIGFLLDMGFKALAANIATAIGLIPSNVARVVQQEAIASAEAGASVGMLGPPAIAAAIAATKGMYVPLIAMAAAAPAAKGADFGMFAPGLIQPHPREMVLPANLAEGLRDIIAGGGAGAQPPNVNLNLNVTAMDGASVFRSFKENEPYIMKFMREAYSAGRK